MSAFTGGHEGVADREEARGMLRYRITRDPQGRYVVLATVVSVVSIAETYATRAEAQDTAAWLNRLPGGSRDADSEKSDAAA